MAEPHFTAVGKRCETCGQMYPEDESHTCANTARAEPDQSTPKSSATNDEDDLIGTVLGERYHILKRLSAGGMGVVYQAQHTLLHSQLAVKVLRGTQDEEAKGRFLREAQIASQIHHPNTVFISDFGVFADGRPYLVMEFLAGPTLRHVIERGALDPLRACQITAQIARGLQVVHDKGIVHRVHSEL